MKWLSNNVTTVVLSLDKKTNLYAFDSSFAEVPFHFNIDLHVANVAEDISTKMSPI